MSLSTKILILREQLNKAIENSEDYEIIYRLSTELDRLIIEYYNNRDSA